MKYAQLSFEDWPKAHVVGSYYYVVYLGEDTYLGVNESLVHGIQYHTNATSLDTAARFKKAEPAYRLAEVLELEGPISVLLVESAYSVRVLSVLHEEVAKTSTELAKTVVGED